MLGDGTQAKPYLHVTDCAAGMLHVLDNADGKGENPAIYNLAPPDITSVKRIAELVVAASPNKSARIDFGKTPQGWPGDVPKSRVKPDKLAALGFRVRYTSDDAVALAVAAGRARGLRRMKPETHAQGDGHGQVKGAANGAPKPISSHAAHAGKAHPLDMERSAYSYVERPNPAIQALYKQHIASKNQSPRVLDIGCGCGANDREFKKRTPHAYVVGIEPNPRAAELASRTCDEVFPGMLEDWLKQEKREPVRRRRSVRRARAHRRPDRLPPRARHRRAAPARAVDHLRAELRRLVQPRPDAPRDSGVFVVWASGTAPTCASSRASSIRELLTYCGFELLDDSSTPALVQSLAPLLRKAFERNVSEGDHLALADSRAFALYQKAVEPVESLVCGVWPELLALQIVHLARLR